MCDCSAHNGFLTAKGLEETAQRSFEGLELAGVVASRYLDRVGSVSAMRRDETTFWPDEETLDEQHRRFLEQFEGGS